MTDTNSGTTTNYTALGAWQTTPASGFTGTESYGVTIYGKVTPDNEIPETGTASYTSTIVGWLLRANQLEEMRGSVFLDVNFGAHTVDAAVDADIVTTSADGTFVFTDIATLSGEGFLETSNRFDGTLQGDTDPTLQGTFEGGFFGPFAAEVGGTLTFSNSSLAGSGGYVGTRDDN